MKHRKDLPPAVSIQDLPVLSSTLLRDRSRADDGFGNLIEVPTGPYRLATEEETKRMGLPANFRIGAGPYAFVATRFPN